LYAKRLLHPLVLCAPFMHRTFEKPLGYAGDYEMVRMMTTEPFCGDSIYAKLLNAFFLNTPPVVAHRNRIDTLVRHLQAETLRAVQEKRRATVFNLGCGPAAEIQRFMADSSWSSSVNFSLLDFNDETVAYAQRTLNQVKHQNRRDTGLQVVKKSVAQLIKDSSKFGQNSFDLVYCAGLFDYLSDNVCTTLLEIFYDLVAPGGLVLVSNVDASNPSRRGANAQVDSSRRQPGRGAHLLRGFQREHLRRNPKTAEWLISSYRTAPRSSGRSMKMNAKSGFATSGLPPFWRLSSCRPDALWIGSFIAITFGDSWDCAYCVRAAYCSFGGL
jgi:SAM-dependent methyltransferase